MDEKEAEARPIMGTIFLVVAVCRNFMSLYRSMHCEVMCLHIQNFKT